MLKDKVTYERLQLLHPLVRDEAIQIWKEIDTALNGKAICRCAYSLRTFKEQDDIYAIGRSKPGKVVTNAKAGLSYHNYGLAVDIVLLKDINGDGTFETASWETNVDFDGDGKSDWQEVVNIFKQYGWVAGIDWKFKDAPHFEKSFGYAVRDLLAAYDAKKLIANTNYVRIQNNSAIA